MLFLLKPVFVILTFLMVPSMLILLHSALILVPGITLIISQSMPRVGMMIGWMLIVKVGMLMLFQSMLSPLPLPRVSMLILVQSMLIIGCMLIIVTVSLPQPIVSQGSLGRHPCTSFQL